MRDNHPKSASLWSTRARSVVDRAGDVSVRALRSRWAVVVVLGFFAVNAAWIALIAREPLLYDERWHFAVIETYSQNALPVFIDAHAPMWLGSQERAGSYLFHVLFSFPERFMSGLGIPEYSRILTLRLMCVALYTAALGVSYLAAVKLGVGRAVALSVIMCVAALPMSPFLAATINYDNLLFLAQSLLLWGVAAMIRQPHPSWALAFTVASLGAFTLLAKFTALPIVGAIGIVGLAQFVLGWIRHGVPPLSEAQGPWRFVRLVTAVGACAAGIALVIERYVRNFLEFGSAVPDCDVVAELARCQAYGPWQRNAVLDDLYVDIPLSFGNAVQYFGDIWWPTILQRFALVRLSVSEPVVYTLQWFVLPILITGVVAIACALWVAVKQRLEMVWLLVSAFVMTAVMFWYNFSEFARFGEPVAVQSRYLLFPLLLVFIVAFQGLASSLRGVLSRPAIVLAGGFVGLAILFGQGGWASPFIIGQGAGWISESTPVSELVVSVMLFVSAWTLDVPVVVF